MDQQSVENDSDENELIAADDEEDEEEEDDEDDDEEEIRKLVKEINVLQDELSYRIDLEKYLLLISKVRKVGDNETLQLVWEKFHQTGLMTTEHWLQRINDAKLALDNQSNFQSILSIHEEAVNDFFDVNLWLSYLETSFWLRDCLEANFLENLIERSLSVAGLDMCKGCDIWKTIIESEKEQLEKLKNKDEKNVELLQQQIQKIFRFYIRKLSIPMLGMENDHQEFNKWMETIQQDYSIDLKSTNSKDITDAGKRHQETLKRLETIKPFEDKLQKAKDLDQIIGIYKEYLKFMKKQNFSLAQCQCLYERAIADSYNDEKLWIEYLQYCDSKIILSDLLFPIYQRALNRCYYSASIHLQWMEAIERCYTGNDHIELEEKINSAFNQALQCIDTLSNVCLWLGYLQFLRRNCHNIGWEDNETKFRDTCEQAITHLDSCVETDDCFEIFKFYSFVEARYLKNTENAHKIWRRFFEASSTKKFAAIHWSQYADFDQLYCDGSKIIKILKEGLELVHDPEILAEKLLNFSKENSDNLNEYQQLFVYCQRCIEKILEKRKRNQQRQAEPEENRNKRKLRENENLSESKRIKAEDRNQQSETKASSKRYHKHGETIKTDDEKKHETIFVSNLDFNCDEEELKKEFEKFGKVNDVRLARNFKGLSKGFGYIEFDSAVSVRKALQNDRMLIHQRPVYISEIDKKKNFQYGQTKEENKLFIKNLPPEITKEDLLEKVFADYKNSIVDARLVTFRNGYSKGIAYIEMENKSVALKAVKEKNGFVLNDRAIFVAISDPSEAMESSNQKKSIKSKNSDPSSNRSDSSSSFMVPYSVLRSKSRPSKTKVQINKEIGPKSSAPTNNQSIAEIKSKNSLSNDQFRSMFMKPS
ncbi:39S ribosomal protein L23 [Sarcoptes scabiei]|nr:39S ribosomal protein L23 [Sarcoptes scabiei]